jgi:hypothetical protein
MRGGVQEGEARKQEKRRKWDTFGRTVLGKTNT